MGGHAEACIGNHHINGSELAFELGDGCVQRHAVANVGHRRRGDATGSTDLSGRTFNQLAAAGDQTHATAG